MSAITKPCPLCRRVLVGRVGTDGRGHTVDEWPVCPCQAGAPAVRLQPDELTYEERVAAVRQTGICMDCDQPVEGTKGKALRCAEHKRRAKLDQENAARRSKAGRAKRRKYERKRLRQKTVREARNRRKRKLHAERMATDPEYAKEYRRRRQRETLASHPSRERYLETQRRHNADPTRAEQKREQARRRYYELRPERPDPHCATCGEQIDWSPPGRPPKYHQTRECNPWHVSEGQAEADAA